MASRRRHLHRRRSWSGGVPILIRVGSRRSPTKYHEVQVTGPKDAGRVARLVEDQVRAFPREPLIISVNGYQPWLEEIFNGCMRDFWSDIADLDREVQFATTMQFPEKGSQRGQYVPWTFIVDHMNVPQVFYWSVGLESPPSDDFGLPIIDNFRFRVGVWQLNHGACLSNREVPVTVIFTKPTEVCEHVVSEIMFSFLNKDDDLNTPRDDDEGICWTFIRLYWLLSDWQNIITAVVARLEEAEKNSHGLNLPVKMRARAMHHEVDRIYELKEFLHFHSRSFKKLQKLKDGASQQAQNNPLWNDMDDAVEDLEQFDSTIDGLKERFNNLIDLEFNIQNAVQADNSQFLSIVATLFLPVSFLASLFGMTTINWPAMWYLYIAIPVLVVSTVFAASFRWSVNKVQKVLYLLERRRIELLPRDFTMLGDELPDGADIPGTFIASRLRKRSHSGRDNTPRSKARSRSRTRGEKGEF